MGPAAGSLRCRRSAPWCARRHDQHPPCRDLDGGRRRGGARIVAERLDRVAFDPTFDDDDREYEQTRKQLAQLSRR
jgi:hypothetical protein